MNMKQTLLMIILFIGFVNVKAQSDATKEKTLSWLNTYWAKYSYEYEYERHGYLDYEIRINSEGDGNFSKHWQSSSNKKTFLKKIKITSVTNITFRPTSKKGDYVIIVEGSGDQNDYFPTYILYKTEGERIFKSIKHLYTFYDNKVQFIDKVSI